MKNIELAHRVIQELINTGVTEFVMCAGARNSPFVYVLNECKQAKVYNYFEERSGAFFALGRIAQTRKPVAIITTSGTAAAELLPATIEATYSSIPLILITADRPKKYRGSGAPQSIDQVGLYSYYTEVSLDLDAENAHLSFKNLSWKKPVHVNVSFEEPLIDAEISAIICKEKAEMVKMPEHVPMNMLKDVDLFLETHRPVVILGYLPERAQETVLEFLIKYQAPVYAEAISGLRAHPKLETLLIKSGDKMVGHLIEKKICDSVLRIGGVPTLRAWRDLEEKHKDLPVLSISYNHYSGLSREVKHFSMLEIFSQLEIDNHPQLSPDILISDESKYQQALALYQKYPQAEPSLVHALSKKLKNQSVYLGNSLPIREWDLAADFDSKPLRCVANRGANGIDGQLSSFLGWANPQAENWCLVGDLTAMYDLSAPWVTSQLQEMKLRIVIINNKGGQIFKRMFNKEAFLNTHDFSFNHWAAMWNWGYNSWIEIPDDVSNLEHKQVIELVPDPEQTSKFWQEMDLLWKI